MSSLLDLSGDTKVLFSGRKNGEDYRKSVTGEGSLLVIHVREGQLVTSSFMFGLLLSGTFDGVMITENHYDPTHRSEVVRALKRYDEHGEKK